MLLFYLLISIASNLAFYAKALPLANVNDQINVLLSNTNSALEESDATPVVNLSRATEKGHGLYESSQLLQGQNCTSGNGTSHKYYKKLRDGAQQTANQAFHFTEGVTEELIDSAKDAVEAVVHPVQTVEGLAYFIRHPNHTFQVTKEQIEQYCSNNTVPARHAECVGRATALGATLVIPSTFANIFGEASILAKTSEATVTTSHVSTVSGRGIYENSTRPIQISNPLEQELAEPLNTTTPNLANAHF